MYIIHHTNPLSIAFPSLHRFFIQRYVLLFTLILFTYSYSNEGYFTQQKSLEYGVDLNFNLQFKSGFGLKEIKYGLFPTFNFFLGNNFYIGPKFGLNHLIEKEILIFTEANPNDPYHPTVIYDTIFINNVALDLGVGLGLAFGKNKTVIPFFESGFLLDFSAFQSAWYSNEDFRRRYYIIPFDVGIKILIREFDCINIGLHNAVYFNREKNEDQSTDKEIRYVLGLIIGFSILRY